MIKTSTRQKALRHVVSALLSGAFTDREINEISSALVHRDEFVSELGLALRDVTQRLSAQGKQGRADTREKQGRLLTSSITKKAVALVKRNGITQSELLSIMEGISPGTTRTVEGKRLSTAKVLDLFLSHNFEKRAMLLEELKRIAAKSEGGDSYLDLITKKLEP